MEEWTNDYIRIPFLERGRDRAVGVDCWGLVRLVYADRLGVELPTLTGYSDLKDRISIAQIIGEESASWWSVAPGFERIYDVAVFKMVGRPMHVGIVVKPGVMLHSEQGKGTHISEYSKDLHWSNRLEGFYRHADRPN